MHNTRSFGRSATLGLLATMAGALSAPATAQEKKPVTIRAVMHSGLRITDPIITTAYIARNHGYMIYDTLFALDGELKIKPQMVDTWKMSDDKLASVLNDNAKQGWQLKAITSVAVKGRLGHGGVDGLIVTFEREKK
jgi:hypothetical protein